MKRGLGKGLEALLAVYDKKEESKDSVNVTTSKVIHNDTSVDQYIKAQGDVYEIEPNKIFANPNQPRKTFDKASLDELAESIRVHGLIQPIIVNKERNGYMIIAGERRWRACKQTGLKIIPAIVKNYSPKQIAEISIIENLQREDLNPMEIAKGINKLMSEHQITQEAVADRLGKSRSAVSNYLRLLTLYPEVIELIEKGKISFGHAKCLVSVNDYTKQVLLAKKVASDKLSVRELEKEIAGMTDGGQNHKKLPQASLELKEFINSLQRKLGTKVSVLGNDKKGRIYIDYYSQDDLDRIFDVILK